MPRIRAFVKDWRPPKPHITNHTKSRNHTRSLKLTHLSVSQVLSDANVPGALSLTISRAKLDNPRHMTMRVPALTVFVLLLGSSHADPDVNPSVLLPGIPATSTALVQEPNSVPPLLLIC